VSTASRCVAECLQLLANLANLSIDWASTMLTFNGAVSGLARVMLRRYEISTERSEDDCVQMKIDSEDHLSDDGGKKSEHLEPSYRHTVVTAEELLCLILAIVTASVLANGGVTNIIAVTSSSKSSIWNLLTPSRRNRRGLLRRPRLPPFLPLL